MRRKALWLTAAGLVLLFGVYHYVRTGKAVDVKMQEVRRGELLVTVTSTSTGTVKSEKEVRVTAERSGRLKRLEFDEGDVVRRGQLLAELDSEELLLEIKRVRASLAARERRKAELQAALQSLRTEVASKIKEAEAVLKEVGWRYQGFKELFERGYISKMELEDVKRQYETALASREIALSGRKRIEAKERELELQEALIREVEAELERLGLDLRRSSITSPIDGVVTSRAVLPGDTLARGTVVATVVGTEQLYIEAPVDEADVAKVRPGQEVRVVMDAYPGEVFRGVVKGLSPIVLGKRLEARTFRVKVVLMQVPATLKPGMSADVEVITGRVEDSLVVPTQSIIEKGGRRLVYIVDDGRARLKEVKTGLFNWNFTEVREGLKEGDLIVVNPDVPGLKDGVRVTSD